MAIKLSGIDVSKHQGNIDWAKVKKSGTDFAIIRAGYGKVASQKDAKFEENYNGCIKNEIPCGAYWYSYAKTPEEAVKEAKICLEIIKGKKLEMPVFYDIEEKETLKLGKAKVSAIAKAFLSTVESNGYYVGLYMSRSPIMSYITEAVRNRYCLWIAEYASKCHYIGNYAMWQYTCKGKVNGINGYVDMDYCYKNLPSIIRKNGLNNCKE